jgi:hypothetical protein
LGSGEEKIGFDFLLLQTDEQQIQTGLLFAGWELGRILRDCLKSEMAIVRANCRYFFFGVCGMRGAGLRS